ncbi:hypothetical protein CKO51_17130 [Rhodopirellula sp. SM50]|nr:hypothetical protein CKO51_17130 [Rhodopirellula sp. SM50]
MNSPTGDDSIGGAVGRRRLCRRGEQQSAGKLNAERSTGCKTRSQKTIQSQRSFQAEARRNDRPMNRVTGESLLFSGLGADE